MICQEYVNHIVMLTNLKEGNKTKCVKYWPDLHQTRTLGVIPLSADEGSNFSVISLLSKEEKIYANYTIRKFSVVHKGLRESRIVTESRVVTQYHYTAWPEHGIPEPLCLADFHDHVTRTKDKGYYTGPTLVHCSSGVGRTGTNIAIDALYKEGESERKVNIAEYVKKMRENRMNMVQTYEQYKTIFLALDAMFKVPTHVHTKPEFVQEEEPEDWYKSPNRIESKKKIQYKPPNESELEKKFQSLLRARPSHTEDDYKLARQNGDKSAVLPLDKYNVVLSSSVPNRGNYINAVTIPSYTKNNAFIITRYPSPEEAVDFLRMLTEHASDIVICMDRLEDVKSTETWMPSANKPKSVYPFSVHCEFKQVSEMCCKGTPIYICQDGSKKRGFSVSIIEPKESWYSNEPNKAELQIRNLLSFAGYLKTEGPITIVSSDGASLCGVFCALHNIEQQFYMDGEVDIFSTVRQLQIRRPELCSTMEEYKMLYDGFEYLREPIIGCGTCFLEVRRNIQGLRKSSKR